MSTSNEILTSHTISIYVSNRPGVLVRVAQVFARRGFNIDSLVVSPGIDSEFSRMTITAKGNLDNFEQIKRHLSKLIDVQKAVEHDRSEVIEKELAMIKLAITPDNKTDILQLVEHFRARTVDFSDESVVIMITGDTEKLDAFIKITNKYNVIEIARTGKVLMSRDKSPT